MYMYVFVKLGFP